MTAFEFRESNVDFGQENISLLFLQIARETMMFAFQCLLLFLGASYFRLVVLSYFCDFFCMFFFLRIADQ